MSGDSQRVETDGLDEHAYRKIVRSRFSEVEIDLILELISRLPVAVWAARGEAHDFAVELWSRGAEELYGFSKQDIIGANYVTTIVNRLERRQAMKDHHSTDETHKRYRNLARDQGKDKRTRLMLTQGVALWHPVLREYLQGEIAVDATDIPGKDRTWLEQVLMPESVDSLLEKFTAMTQAAFRSVDEVGGVAADLVKVFLGESAECSILFERQASKLAVAGEGNGDGTCEYDPAAVVRWCMRTECESLIVDYVATFPPVRRRGPHTARFPGKVRRPVKPAPFAVALVRDEESRPRGGVFVSLASGVDFSELTVGVLAAVCGSVKLALAIEDQIDQTKRQGSLEAKERERQATERLSRQYRHAVMKKADLLGMYAGLLAEAPTAERIARIATALRSMAQNLEGTGARFRERLDEEDFSVADVLSSVTGAAIEDYEDIVVERGSFPDVTMRGVRPFIEAAIENLIINAVEAQGYRGRIGVWCSPLHNLPRQHWAEIDVFVTDDGPGLARDVFEKISEGRAITTKGADRGLGLVITRMSLQECGAVLEPLDQGLKGWKGACFRVRLRVRTRKEKK